DGGMQTDIVQVPLSYRSAPVDSLTAALVGQIGGTGESDVPVWVYDAAHDPAFVTAWLDLIRDQASADLGEGECTASGHSVPGSLRLPGTSGSVRVSSGEQSNTSVIVDDGVSAAIVKIF